MVWYTGCSSALEAQIPRGVQCPWHGGLPRTGQFWGRQFPSVLPAGIGFLSDCSFQAQSYLSPLWVFRVASKPLESVRLCVEPFPRGCLCLSLTSPTSGTSCYTCFQSPFLCVLGASGHAGNLGWCVVSGQCDLWAWGEQWVCKSEWSLTGMAEGCSGEWQELIETLWIWCWFPLAVWLQELFLLQSVKGPEEQAVFPEMLSVAPWLCLCSLLFMPREILLFLVCPEPVSCTWQHHMCLVDIIQHNTFKIKCCMLLSVMMTWRNSGVQYLNPNSVFLADLVQGYHLNCYQFSLVIRKLNLLVFHMKLSQIKKYIFSRAIPFLLYRMIYYPALLTTQNREV